MARKVEEKFASEQAKPIEADAKRGFTLLAHEVAEWWQMSLLMRKALAEVIRSFEEEADHG